MKKAEEFVINEHIDECRIFNSTDDILRRNIENMSDKLRVISLLNLLHSEMVSQQWMTDVYSKGLSKPVTGFGIVVCNFGALSVYHYVRVVCEVEYKQKKGLFDEVKDLAIKHYNEKQYGTGPLGDDTTIAKFGSYCMGTSASVFFEHIMFQLPENRLKLSEYCVEVKS